MRINMVDSQKNEVNITLDASELVAICNSMYRDSERPNKANRLYADMMMCRELSQYGHIDGWGMAKILEQREEEVLKNFKTQRSTIKNENNKCGKLK